jgi:hypothetical protein
VRTVTVAPATRVAAAAIGEGSIQMLGAAAALASAVAVAPAELEPALGTAVMGEIRSALRGRTVDELAETLARDRMTVEASLRALVAQGRLVVRGPRFFVS